MNKFKTTAAAAALMALPFAASASPAGPADLASVVVSLVPDAYSESYTVSSSDAGVIFNFNVIEALKIPTFRLSASSPTDGVATTMYEITKPATGPSSFGIVNMDGVGADIVPGDTYAAGDEFSVIFTETSDQPISYTVSFSTAAVPVPAAGLLLLTALGGAAALRRKKA